MKRVLAILLTVTLLTFFVSGCGSSESSATDSGGAEEAASQSLTEDVQAPEYSTVELVDQVPEEEISIAVIGCQTNAWWNNVRAGVDMATEYLSNYNCRVDYIVAEDMDVGTITSAIDAASVQGYDGIAFASFCDGTSSYVERAVDNGAQVCTLYGEDSNMTDKRLAFLGSDSYAFGKKAGELLSEAMGEEGGQYIIVHESYANMSASARVDGAREGLAENPKNECVGEFEGKDSAELTYNIVMDAINANPDLKGVYCAAGGAYGASKAVEDAGKSGEIAVFGHDMTPENLEYAIKGDLIINDYNCMQYAIDACIILYNKIVANQDPAEKIITGGIEGSMYADKSNAQEWMDLLFSDKK